MLSKFYERLSDLPYNAPAGTLATINERVGCGLYIYNGQKWLKYATNYDKRFRVGFCWLNGAPWYKIDNSPKWVKEKAVNDLTQLTQLTPDEQKEVNQLINIIHNSNEPEKLDKLESHINMSDKWRGSNTWDITKWRINDS